MLRLLLALLFAVQLAGCATYGQERFFERDGTARERSTASADQDGRATVYFFRERGLMQLSYAPVPPVYFAVDDRLVSIMPVGTHVVLSLEPGQHKFTRLFIGGDWLFPVSIHRHDVDLVVEAGKRYHVGSVNTLLGNPIQVIDGASGERAVATSELARLIHNPRTIDEFSARLKEIDAKKRASPVPATRAEITSSTVAESLPSTSQVVGFLEGLATLALAALLIYGAAVGAGGNSAATLPPESTIVRPAIVARAPAATVDSRLSTRMSTGILSLPAQPLAPPDDSPTRWRTSTGSLSDIVQSKERISVRNLTTGVTHTIENGRIVGTDGTGYRVFGSMVVSDTGHTYEVRGNELRTSDGRICTKTGILISCR